MTSQLSISIGQCSDKGRKDINQDSYGSYTPRGSLLNHKGFAAVMADGISSSEVSQIASETAVKSFLDDYYCTSETWSVQHAAEKVLDATNSWLYSQSQQSPYHYDKDKGYVCTLSALVIKGNKAHIFHVGDTRVYRLNQQGLELLTKDHRLWVNDNKSYLSRALGIDEYCEFDYHTLSVSPGDIFLLATDGVYEFVDAELINSTIAQCANDLEAAAAQIVDKAYQAGSDDNLSLQIIKVEQLAEQSSQQLKEQIETLPFPPELSARMSIDNYTIVRQIHASSRSHVFLALDEQSGEQVILKTPSVDLRDDPDYLERFYTEEWIARRINSAYVLKASRNPRQRNYLYTVFEYIEGQTLAQWITDNPKPELAKVREVVEQIAKGLRAFHRMDMLHQDLKPDNIMIDSSGTIKIIDFGSVWAAGLAEQTQDITQQHLLGTALYSAPELFLGIGGSTRAEQFSLAVITYYMLSGRYPYGTKVAGAKSHAAQKRLRYQSVIDSDSEIPAWIDDALEKALHINPLKRYEQITEFLCDLRQPNKAFLNKARAPLVERNPVAVWQGISAILAAMVVYLLLR
ncbi:bifunctional protein-serine/threonine kinase/phosphatase [Agarivorans albus]|uniref:Serine/threonine protein kinase n=1 Tax=Agarivorans albus MKT 106 TaxID=1331007 RepID=R9PSS2_AGAAL|nr:bifunctional protein-serine/threonine kinase/phosphatase [Agarivorans albus]GAD01236.1 serine/threonine protein kinase [Agarivorans albus MKT 106]